MSAARIELLADADRRGGWLLLADRIRQSYVDMDDPTYLDFEYARALGDIVDALPAGPLAVTHIGGGAMMLARYVAVTRPGSPQIVLEPDAEVTALVRAKLPLPRGARVRVRPVGGRAGLAELRDGSADVIILDAFQGGRVPADLGTVEFFTDAARVLRADGLMLANIADGPALGYARRVVAALSTVFAHGLLIADPAVLRGRRFGNVELAASAAPLPIAAAQRSAARAIFPRRVVAGADLVELVGDARPARDADALRSPAPPEETWRVALSDSD
ncbi:MAG: fused MFS/spermidine synthase [Actinomycetia bacterium]|nr:fused MFS/spermidine synthase [Actinomycetes bacterium]